MRSKFSLVSVSFVVCASLAWSCSESSPGGGGGSPDPDDTDAAVASSSSGASSDGGRGDGGQTGSSSGGASSGGLSEAVLFDDLGFTNPELAVDDGGVTHLVYSASINPMQLVYARCAGNCERPASWSRTLLEAAMFLNDFRMTTGPGGSVHVMYARSQGSGDDVIYASCTSDCANGDQWSKTIVNAALPFPTAGGWFRSAGLAVDDTGRVSFAPPLGDALGLMTCAGNCNVAGNWSGGTVRAQAGRSAMAARGGTLHQVVHDTQGNLRYRNCSADCTNAGSWQESPPLFGHDNARPVAIRVVPSGRVSIAYNQGVTGDSGLAASERKLFIRSCNSNCLVPESWQGVVFSADDDGDDGIALGNLGDALVLTSTGTLEATVHLCEQNCGQPSAWTSGVFESSDTLNAAMPPDSLAGCTTSFASWYPSRAAGAITPEGKVVLVSASYMLRTCAGQSTASRLPGYGRAYVVQ